jgi:hypothetical protein
MPASSRRRAPQPESTSARDLLRDFERRREILEEHFLRRDVARDEALRAENPVLWRQLETGRRARNREKATLNRRLRAEGLTPVDLEPSLAQRVKKLRQLEARNKAESARRPTRP